MTGVSWTGTVITVQGAPVECRVGQNFDKFRTNVQVLSNICPNFVQVLSMSNICQNNQNFTKFCQKFVKILSKNFVICPKIVKEKSPCPKILVLDKPWTIKCPVFVQVLSILYWGQVTKLLVQTFVKILSKSNFCPIFVQLQFQVHFQTFVQNLSKNKKCPIFVQTIWGDHNSKRAPKWA